ncbi:hypothetical protein Tco_1310203 [Tanacetum coccineum]
MTCQVLIVVAFYVHEDIADLQGCVNLVDSWLPCRLLQRSILAQPSSCMYLSSALYVREQECPLAHQMIHEDLLPEPDCLTKVELVHEQQDAEMSLHQIVLQ